MSRLPPKNDRWPAAAVAGSKENSSVKHTANRIVRGNNGFGKETARSTYATAIYQALLRYSYERTGYSTFSTVNPFPYDTRVSHSMAVAVQQWPLFPGAGRVPPEVAEYLPEILTFLPKLRQTDRGGLSSLTSRTRNGVHRFDQSAIRSARRIRNYHPPSPARKTRFFEIVLFASQIL